MSRENFGQGATLFPEGKFRSAIFLQRKMSSLRARLLREKLKRCLPIKVMQ